MKQKHTKYTQINTNKSAEQLVSGSCTQVHLGWMLVVWVQNGVDCTFFSL